MSINSTELVSSANITSTPWGEDAGLTIWYVGVVLHLVGGALGSLGLNLQRWRYQHGQSRAPSAEVFAARIWCIGFVLVAMDAVLTCLSYAFASLCKLATLGILAMCLNTSIAPTCLKQSVHKWDKRGALIASTGAIIAITCANPKTPTYSLDQIIDYLGSAQVVVSLCAANAVLVGLLATVVSLRWQSDALEAERQHLRLEYQRMHRANAGSPVSMGGKRSIGRDSPTSGSDSLVTAPSELDAADRLPIRPEPLRPRVLDLAGRLQGGRRQSTGRGSGSGSNSDAGSGSDDANLDATNSLDDQASPGDLSGSGGQGTGEMNSITADEYQSYDEYEERRRAEFTSGAWDYAESRLRDTPEWSKVQRLEPRMQRLYLLVLPAAAGVSAGLAVLFGKVAVELGKSTVLDTDYPYKRFSAYLIVLYTLSLLSLQVKLLNQAIVASNRSFKVLAHYQVVRLGTCVMGGIMFFRELDTITAGQNFLFVAGCVICVFGTLKMQGKAKDIMANATQTSRSAPGRNDVGNATHTMRRSDGSPLGGANRDELDDLLHLLEIDTTTRNWTLVELRQQIAVERAMRTRLRAEIQEMDARITRAQISVADARRSDT